MLTDTGNFDYVVGTERREAQEILARPEHQRDCGLFEVERSQEKEKKS